MDRILRAATDDGMVTLSAVMSTDLTERARQIHGLSPTAAAALGRALSGASMLGDMMKEEDSSLTLRISGGGPIGNIVVVSDEEGCVRGYVSHPEADLPLKANGHLRAGGSIDVIICLSLFFIEWQKDGVFYVLVKKKNT